MAFIGKSGLGLAAAAMLSALSIATPSYALTQKQAMAACRAKYGAGITSVVIKKNGRIVCQEGPGRNATRKEVYEYCKKRFGATTILLRQKPSGNWECRYSGLY